MFTVHLIDGSYDITPGEVIEYLKDQGSFAAKKRNVSKETWVPGKNIVIRINAQSRLSEIPVAGMAFGKKD